MPNVVGSLQDDAASATGDQAPRLRPAAPDEARAPDLPGVAA